MDRRSRPDHRRSQKRAPSVGFYPLASLAHDFRTPLTVISGRLANLAQHNPEAHDALVAAQRLDHMMTDLIGAARIEAGSVAPIRESIDLVDVVGAACDRIAVPTHLSLLRNIPADLPFIKSDAVLLHHVLTNLIDNAFRHARSSVHICAKQRNDWVVLEVRDDGPGVPVAERERIFDRFERIEGSDRTDGSGLGLAIVKGFANAMGITVAVDAAPAGGARFTLELPISGSLQT